MSKTQTQLTTDDSAKFRPSLTFQTHRSLLPFSKKKTSSICQNKSGCDLLLLTIQLSEKSIKSDFEFYLIQVVCIFQKVKFPTVSSEILTWHKPLLMVTYMKPIMMRSHFMLILQQKPQNKWF